IHFPEAGGGVAIGDGLRGSFSGLARRKVDGGASGMSFVRIRKWYEVGKYVTAIHYVPLVYPVQVNKSWWEGLDQSQRDIIKKAVASTEGDAVAQINKEFKDDIARSEEHTSELQSRFDLVCRLLLETK